jgi:octaprenyl-diphosphate synthase
VGDYLYSKAFKLMAEHGTLRIVHELAATTNVMSEGEVFQLVKCGDVNLTEAEYLKIIEEKTSVLISSACAVGAILGRAKPARIRALKRFGMTVGSAFQIIDDTLDYMAKEKDFGKAIGKDLDEGKLTLPLIRTLCICDADERNEIIDIIKRPERNGDDVAGILNVIHRYNGIRYAMDKASAFISEGKAILSGFPDSPGRQALSAIADFVVARHS